MALWRYSYKVLKTIFTLYWVYMQKGMWKKIQVWISCLPDLLNLIFFFFFFFFFGNLKQSKFWNHFQAEIIVFNMVWKNQKSWEPWLVGFWVNRHSKNAKNFCKQSFLSFWAAIMDLLVILWYAKFSFL